MNRKLFLAAIATVALASCSQDEAIEVNKGRAIDFRVSTEMNTRGTAVETADAMKAFNVTAFVKDAATTASNYFTNQLWEYEANNWGTDNPAYWPNAGTLRFFAYHPTSAGATISPAGQTINNFTPATNITEQVDLLVAYNEGSKETQGGVDLNFRHALSQIVVEAVNCNANYKIEVKAIKLAQISTKETMTFPGTATTGNVTKDETTYEPLSRTGLWTSDGTSGLYTCVSKDGENNTVTLTEDAGAKSLMPADGQAFMMIPQDLTAYATTSEETKKGAYIGVLCKIYRLDGNSSTLIYPKKADTGDAAEKFAYTIIPIDTDWQPGRKYTYTLKFFDGADGGAGLVDPHPGNGTDDLDGDGTSDGNTDIETNPEPEGGAGTGGEIIAGKQITFSVTIDDWKEKEETPTVK